MLTYEFKLYRTHHTKRLDNLIGIAQKTYNHFIKLCQRHYRFYTCHLGLKCLSLGTQSYKLQKHLTKLKHTNYYSWMNDLNGQVLQNIIERITRAYNLFFKAKKSGKKSSSPKFKKYWKYKSLTYKVSGWKLDEEHRTIFIQGHPYKYFQSRRIYGKIKTITVKRKNKDWYIYITVDGSRQPITATTGKIVGFDFGLKTYLYGSNGTIIQSPLFFKKNLKHIQKLHKSLSRKVKGSTHWIECLHSIQKAYTRLRNQRKDFHFKTALRLCKEYDFICLETLNIKAMCRRWGRKVHDLGFSNFTQILNHMASKYHKTIVYIDKWYPSSQLCSECGYRYKELKNHLEVRQWKCPHCGHVHDRDLNAAKNIEIEGCRELNLL